MMQVLDAHQLQERSEAVAAIYGLHTLGAAAFMAIVALLQKRICGCELVGSDDDSIPGSLAKIRRIKHRNDGAAFQEKGGVFSSTEEQDLLGDDDSSDS